MKAKILTLALVCTTYFVSAQNIAEQTYAAYLANSMTLWKKAIEQAKKTTSTNEEKYQLALTQYGLLSATMASKDEDTFDEYESRTSDLLEALEDHSSLGGNAKALLSSILGFKMGYSPWKGMFLGSKSSGLIEQAAKESPQSPLVWKLYGSSKLYTPSTFGGDPSKAVEYFTKSISLYETQGDTISNWLYLDAHAFLGMAYQKINKPQKALEIYEKALEIEPDYNWVKHALIPSAKSQQNQ